MDRRSFWLILGSSRRSRRYFLHYFERKSSSDDSSAKFNRREIHSCAWQRRFLRWKSIARVSFVVILIVFVDQNVDYFDISFLIWREIIICQFVPFIQRRFANGKHYLRFGGRRHLFSHRSRHVQSVNFEFGRDPKQVQWRRHFGAKEVSLSRKKLVCACMCIEQ